MLFDWDDLSQACVRGVLQGDILRLVMDFAQVGYSLRCECYIASHSLILSLLWVCGQAPDHEVSVLAMAILANVSGPVREKVVPDCLTGCRTHSAGAGLCGHVAADRHDAAGCSSRHYGLSYGQRQAECCARQPDRDRRSAGLLRGGNWTAEVLCHSSTR